MSGKMSGKGEIFNAEKQRRREAEMVRLGEIFELQMGKTPSRDNKAYWGGTHAWVAIADIKDTEAYISTTKETITDEAVGESNIKPVPSDTLIMSFKLSIGRVAITRNQIYTNEAIMAFLDKGLYEFDLHYLYHQFKCKDWTSGGNRAVMGTTLNKASLSFASIILPPLPEQKRIAATLDRICELKKNAEVRLAKLDLLVKSRFVEMFGEVPNTTTLSEICSIITDGTHQPPKFVETGIPFLFVSNIVTDCLTYTAEKFIDEATYSELIKRTPIEKGDLLLSTVGSYGHPAIVNSDKRFLFQRHIAYLKPLKGIVDSVFLHGAILSANVQEQIERKVKGIAQKTLNLSEIKTIAIPLPPLALQREFAAFVEKVEKLKEGARRSAERLDVLYRSKLQEYFG